MRARVFSRRVHHHRLRLRPPSHGLDLLLTASSRVLLLHAAGGQADDDDDEEMDYVAYLDRELNAMYEDYQARTLRPSSAVSALSDTPSPSC